MRDATPAGWRIMQSGHMCRRSYLVQITGAANMPSEVRREIDDTVAIIGREQQGRDSAVDFQIDL